MNSIGVDLHKETVVLVVLNDKGEIVERKTFATKCKNTIKGYFSSYGLQCQVAFESVGFYQWFWELLNPVVGNLYLADPVGIRAHAGRKAKTDRNDALLIAQLLHEGKLPVAYVPKEPVASLRKLVRLRHGVAKDLAGARKSLRWISLKTNLPGPKILFSDNAQKWILAQEDKFSEYDRKAARLKLDIIISLERTLNDIEREVCDYIKKFPQLEKLRDLLKSIPGIGDIVAATIIAETGDITRFDNADQLSSGTLSESQPVRRKHPPRTYLENGTASSQVGSPAGRMGGDKMPEEARRIFNRISRKAGKKKAATAMARKLLVYAWSVARRNQPFKWETCAARKETENKKGNIEEWCYQV